MLRGTFSDPIPSLTGFIKKKESISGTLAKKCSLVGTISKDASLHYYDDDYIFTPSEEEQVIPTSNKFVSRNIIVNPIPNNYGLISWDGRVITVS